MTRERLLKSQIGGVIKQYAGGTSVPTELKLAAQALVQAWARVRRDRPELWDA